MRSHSLRMPTEKVHLHPVVERLLARADAGRLFPAVPTAGPIQVLPDGTIIGGAGRVLTAVREGRRWTPDEVVHPPAGEDPAVYDLLAVGDLVAGAKDPLALGAAYGELRRHWQAQGRPRKGWKVHKYVRRHGQKPHERIEGLLRAVLGYSPDQLAKFETVLRLPTELKEAFAAGGVPLRPLLELAARPREEIEAVAAEIRGGAAPAEAVTARAGAEKPVSAARTWVRRLLRALDDAGHGLAGRLPELMYLDEHERAGVERGRWLLGELLALPTKGDALAAVLTAPSDGRTAG